MLKKTLLSMCLAEVTALRTSLKSRNWKHDSESVMTKMKAQLISDTTCYPSGRHFFDSLDDALAEKPTSGMYEDPSFYGDSALYSVNFVGDGGQTTIAGPSDADLVA